MYKGVVIVEEVLSASSFDCALFQELFPANKRSCEHFSKYFTDAGLKELSDFARNQQSIGARKELQKELEEQMSRGDPLKDVSLFSFFSFTFTGSLFSVTLLRVAPKIASFLTSALFCLDECSRKGCSESMTSCWNPVNLNILSPAARLCILPGFSYLRRLQDLISNKPQHMLAVVCLLCQ